MMADQNTAVPARVAHRWLFGLKPHQYTGTHAVENHRRVREVLDSVSYGHLRLGQNDFEFAVDMGRFFDANEVGIRQWLADVRREITPEPATRGQVDTGHRAGEPAHQAFHVIVSPLTPRNAAFVATVNDVVFDGEAQVVGIEVEAEFKDSFAARYADLAALRRKLAGTGLELTFHYVDDATTRGLSLLRLRSLLTELFDPQPDQTDEDPRAIKVNVFRSVIVLINRWSPNTWRNLLGGVFPRLSCYADIWAPHLNTLTSACPACDTNGHLHAVEDSCSTAMLAGEFRALRMRQMEPIRFEDVIEPDDPVLKRCSNGLPMSGAVKSAWKRRQLIGRRRLWWRHLLTYGLRHLEQDIPDHRCDRRPAKCGRKELINCPSIVAASLIDRLTWIASARAVRDGGQEERPLDHFAAAIWAATTGELAARKSVREAALALVNGLLAALLDLEHWPAAPTWEGQPDLPEVEKSRDEIPAKWQALVAAVRELANSHQAEGSHDKNAWESLLRCLMRASAELGGTFLLRRRRMVEVFDFGWERGLDLARLGAYYVYCLKLLTSPGADRSRSAYLDHLLLTGQEGFAGDPPQGVDDAAPKTVGQRFVDHLKSEPGFEGVSPEVWAALAEFADVAYLENTKCLQAVLEDMGTLRGGNVDLEEYLPEHSAECLTGQWPPGSPSREESKRRADALLAASAAFAKHHDGQDDGQGAGNGYDILAAELNNVWATFLGQNPAGCSTSLAVETKKKDMLRRTNIAALPTANAIQPRFDADSIGLTIDEQFSVESGPGRQYLDVGWHGGAQAEKSKVETLAQHKFLQAEWRGNLSEPVGFAHVRDRDRRVSPSIIFGFQDGRPVGLGNEDSKKVWCLIRLGLVTDADGGSHDQDAYMAFEAPEKNVDVASLMNAARAVALFRGKMADKLRSEHRRGILRSVAAAKLIERELTKRGALYHEPSGTGGGAMYTKIDSLPIHAAPNASGVRWGAPFGPDGAVGSYVNAMLASLNRIMVVAASAAPMDASALELLVTAEVLAREELMGAQLEDVIKACSALPRLWNCQHRLWLKCPDGRLLTAEEPVAGQPDSKSEWLNALDGRRLRRYGLSGTGATGPLYCLSKCCLVTVVASLVDSANRYGVPNGGIILSLDADGFLWVTNSVDDGFTMEALDPGLKRLAGISLAAVADLFARLPNPAGGRPVGIRVRSLRGAVAPGLDAPGDASGGAKWFGVGVPLYQPVGQPREDIQ